ncbi:threonine synthase [Sediminispirochaeta smaragdinae]|uniref:Threonine synthase n=1 Tax=Sediminispirochaeta smaragdinae (strain DSM 11293 / JCM 15392 / SEBR 4228) TaxID=573413 RepID=E1RCD7_SEDSS|nr:threonine synthase [Sediminispirochaeta smaragdinae]ADK80017.1 threonine synthase [Sediminispirochaeta smaragdinae DSM 11293]
MAEITYHSTRDAAREAIPFSQAVVRGIAPDGGLYVPSSFPGLDITDPQLAALDYEGLAEKVLSLLITDFSKEELSSCVHRAYGSGFRHPGVAPIHSCGNVHFIELYHGPTLAFKDMALSILPHVLTTAAGKLGIDDTIVILTATSGDTGKAALEGFADVPGTQIVVFYPTDGVSEVQKRQMTTQEGANTHVVGITGNFDDAQNGVKAIFADGKIRERIARRGYRFSSANSINPGRLLPQIVYYINGYLELVRRNTILPGEKVHVVVPTGNFGNILAAWYARHMGLPVGRFICASNSNNVLTDFMRTGRYSLDRRFSPTISPSMDILISSNLERFLYELADRDPAKVVSLMSDLKNDGVYEIDRTMMKNMADFYGGFADDTATVSAIEELYRTYGYVVDTHTAVGYRVYQDFLRETGDDRPVLLASTASPFKFSRSVAEAVGVPVEGKSDFELIDLLAERCCLDIPAPIRGIADRSIRHPETCKKDEMARVVEELLS